MQKNSLEHAINLAEAMINSDALYNEDKHYGQMILTLLKDAEKHLKIIDLKTIEAYASYFLGRSNIPRISNYFINYEEGTQIFKDMSDALNTLVEGLR